MMRLCVFADVDVRSSSVRGMPDGQLVHSRNHKTHMSLTVFRHRWQHIIQTESATRPVQSKQWEIIHIRTNTRSCPIVEIKSPGHRPMLLALCTWEGRITLQR